MNQTDSTELTPESLRAHLGAAKSPALLMLVAHLTGDAQVLREDWRPKPEAMPSSGLARSVEEEILEWCCERLDPYLASAYQWPTHPQPGVIEAIGEWCIGAAAADASQLLDAAFVPDGTDPKAPGWTAAGIAPERDIRVGIIGAGISGLLAGYRMKQAGVPFTIFEKAQRVGGTWSENTYPDCRTDVNSHIYTYSFFPHDWPSHYGRQEVILDYLNRFAKENEILEHVQLGTEVSGAVWDDQKAVWRLEVVGPDGVEEVSTELLISAVGQLNRPMVPPIDGLETFAGPAFHSAEWDHAYDFTGKRVAVIGTGASALQFAPALSRVADSVTIFQRSAPWLLSTPELRDDLCDDARWLLRHLPHYRAYYRFSMFLPRVVGQLAAGIVDPDYPPTERAVSAMNEQLRVEMTEYLVAEAGDREDLAAKIIPDYPPGAKRMIRDDGTWVATMKRENVELLTDPVDRIDESGVWTRSGRHVDVDAIVFGTGFQAADYLTPMRIVGSGGRDLHGVWGIDACAFMGMTVPDFPNLFCMYGPNTNTLLHGNLVFYMECQAGYITSALRLLLESGSASMSLRSDVFADYKQEVTEASAMRVWGWSKTHSWYQNAEGRSTIMWPLPADRYLDGTKEARAEDYELR